MWWTSHKANKFSRATLSVARENRQTQQVYFHLPQSRLQASMKYMYVCNTRPFANSYEPTQDKLNRDKMADMVAAVAHGISNSQS